MLFGSVLLFCSQQLVNVQWSDDSKRVVAVGDGKERFGAVFLFDSGSSVGEISGHGTLLYAHINIPSAFLCLVLLFVFREYN